MAVIKTIDLVGVSPESWRAAAQEALAEASKTIRVIEGMDILDVDGSTLGCYVKDLNATRWTLLGSGVDSSFTSGKLALRARGAPAWFDYAVAFGA